jgi:hypothetical protein
MRSFHPCRDCGIQRLAAGLSPENVAAWDAVYAKIRESNESLIAKNADKFSESGAAALGGLVEEIIAQNIREHRGPVAPGGSPTGRRTVGGSASGLRHYEISGSPRKSCMLRTTLPS